MAGRSDPRQLQALREARKRNLLGPTQNAALQEIERRFMSFVEPAATMASAMVAEPVSGFVGLAATPFGSDVATRAINKTQEAMTYQPRTEAGMQGLQSLSNFMAPVGQAFEGASSFLGDAAFDATGSPALGAAAYSIPTMGLEALGLKAARAIPGRQFEMGDIGPGAMGGRQRGIFAGVNAKNADMDALTRAQAMASQGANRDEVWSQTGWFKDVDGGWKFEIDDSGYSFPKKGMEDLQSFGARRQGDIIKHDELFANYPDVKEMTTIKDADAGYLGAYFREEDSMSLSPRLLNDALSRKKTATESRESLTSTNLHETQHAIQDREGFSSGGNTENSRFILRQYAEDAKEPLSGDAYRFASLSNRVGDLSKVEYAAALQKIIDSDSPKPSSVTRLSDFYQYADQIRDKFGPEPKKPGPMRDGWVKSAAAYIRKQNLKQSDDGGAGRATAADLPEIKKEIRKLERQRDKFSKASRQYADVERKINKLDGMNNRQLYDRIAGEAEARNVEARRAMTPEERNATPPWETLDVPENEIFTRRPRKKDG